MGQIDFDKVNLLDGFWKKRYLLNKESSIPNITKRFEETRFGAFKFVKDATKDIFYDSDVAKLIEAIAYILSKDKKYKKYEKICDELIDSVVKNADNTGYFNSYFQVVEKENIFTRRTDHELYNLGHLIEAGVAYEKVTGKSALLNACKKYIDYVINCFVIKKTAKFCTPGHEEIELALLKLYDYTGDKKYYDLASFFLEKRGNNNLDIYYDFANSRYAQDNEPIRDLKMVEGHAVRAMYLYDGMAKYALINNDKKIIESLKTIYDDLITKQYITGAIGSYRIGEILTIPFDLPNLTAYSESCASIGEIMFLHDLYQLEHKSVYQDDIERILYNGFLSSTSLDGKSFFYENPLEIRKKDIGKETSVNDKWRQQLPIIQRVEVFNCSCCPPNIARFVASIGKYIYYQEENKIYVNQFISSLTLIDGIKIKIKSNYPNKFDIKLDIESEQDNYYLYVRLPRYVDKPLIYANSDEKIEDGYMIFKIAKGKTTIKINFKTKVKMIEANACNVFCQNKVAVMYGPIVYCLEEVDNGDELNSLFITGKKTINIEYNEEYGMNIFDFEGLRKENNDRPYQEQFNYIKQNLHFIPYYCFANRKESDMIVWVNDKVNK